ncbi:hypothetical protein PLICRDRAFT_27806 [Plicaturopsis crispa FD-325 SS-3]|nr:hypothetical protein PLICRDRAFT_27806 [Plicaturopsis crispa FD-325 SS-3]
MNMLRQPVRAALRAKRAYSTPTPFVPPEAMHRIMPPRKGGPLPRPESSHFFTVREGFYDQVAGLEEAINYTRHSLRLLHLYPLPPFARASLPELRPMWRQMADMQTEVKGLNTTRYRQLIELLTEINEYYRIAVAAGETRLSESLRGIISLYERTNKDKILAARTKKTVKFDQFGRSYTVGRRKTSSARVWIIPVQPHQVVAAGGVLEKKVEPADAAVDLFVGDEGKPQSAFSKPAVGVTSTTVLVNNRPLAEYFPIAADREAVIRPLKLAGALGAYNVFTIVRGGGTTGQSGAISNGIAKGLAAHDPSIANILRKAKLVRRDPRMVERKKTGFAKARKRYTWVKR